MSKTILAAVAASLLALAAGPARSADSFITLAAYDQTGNFWFRTDSLPPTTDGRLTLNVLQVRRTTASTASRPFKIEGRYLTVSCDWLTIGEYQPSDYVEEDGEIRGGAIPGDGPAPLLQPQGGLGDQLIRQLCGAETPPPGKPFASVAEAVDYARRHQTAGGGSRPAEPPPPAPELWKGAFSPIARSVDGAQMFLDRGWITRSGDQVATRVLVIMGPALNEAGEVVAVRNVRFDCKARTETLLETWDWSLDRKHYSHAAGPGWTRSLASRPFSSQVMEAACVTVPPRGSPNKIVTFATVAEALAYARKSWPPPPYTPAPERDVTALPAQARYVFTKEVEGNLLYLVLMDDEPDDGKVLYWLVAAQRKPGVRDGQPYSGMAGLSQLDCINARERDVGFVYYDANFKVFSADRGIGDWTPVAPDTYGAALMATACEPARPRWFGLEGLEAFKTDYRERLTRPPEPED